MDFFELLRIEHASLRDLLDQLIDKSTSSSAEEAAVSPPRDETLERDWPEIMHDLKLALIGHNRAEEAVLYDALRRIPHRSEMADLKTEEHHLAEELLEDLEEINPADRQWAMKLGLLKNQIESHVAEEETTVFSLLLSEITDEESERMSTEFESLRDDIVQGARYHPKGRSVINPAGLDLDS